MNIERTTIILLALLVVISGYTAIRTTTTTTATCCPETPPPVTEVPPPVTEVPPPVTEVPPPVTGQCASVVPPYAERGSPTVLTQLTVNGADQMKLVDVRGGEWEGYAFTRADLLGYERVQFFGDASNRGGKALADKNTIAISECAGDFNPAQQPACLVTLHEGTFLYLNFGAAIAGGFWCNLDSAKTYYFNVHVGDSPCSSQQPRESVCGFRMRAGAG